MRLWTITLLVSTLGLAACTTPLPKACPPVIPLEPLPAIPAECTLPAILGTPARLHTLPTDFDTLPGDTQQRVLVSLKAQDTVYYQQLRFRLLRCARQLVEDRQTSDNAANRSGDEAVGASRGLPSKDGQP